MGLVNLPLTSRSSDDANDFQDVLGNDQAITAVVNGGLENDNISASAGISYSKLALTNSIVAADIAAGAVGSSEIATDAVGSDEIAAGAVGSSEIATGAVDTAELATGAVTGVKLSNEVTQLYDPFQTAAAYNAGSSLAAGTYPFNAAVALSASLGAVGTGTYPIFRYVPTTVDLTGLTTTMVLQAQIATASAPGITLTVGLYPVSGVSSGTHALGTVVSGSTIAFASPSANSISQNTVEFAEPSAGQYVVGVATSGTATPTVNLAAQLFLRRA